MDWEEIILFENLYIGNVQSIGFPGGSVVKNLSTNAGNSDSIPGSGRSGEGDGNPLQYPCLGNPMDREACLAAVHGVTRVGHKLATKQ